ncbi:MAG: murein biosynthesis integral membrane protein MurJ [Patescibacteria group bacterium]|nr:murein biosynthesis integral membrane protein MurJ [Patescibacteria group bacterium]
MQKLKDLFNGENSVKGATIILIATLLISNFLGLVRDHFLAQKIPTAMLDTYYAAFRIPDLIFNTLILGSISAAFIPIFTSFISHKKNKEAWEITSSVINIAMLVLMISLAILFFLMPYIIPLMVPKFDLARQATTISLARIFLLSPILFGISYILGGVLNSFKRFVAYALAPLVYNLSIILATLFFADKFGVFGVAWGVVVGAGLHMLVQIPTVMKLGFRYYPIMLWQNLAVRKIGKLMIPRAIGLGAMQVMLLVYTAIASSLAPGSVSVFNLADNIQTMPTVVFATSFSTAIFPTLSATFSLKKICDYCQYIWRTIRAILFALVPATIIFILLRAQIVRVILGSGYFGWQQTIDTANTLGLFAISLVAQGLVPLLAKAYYAQHDSRTPTIISIISVVLSIIFAYILVRFMGVSGLALAFSLASFVNLLALYLVLRSRVVEFKNGEKNFWPFLGKITLATLLMAIVMQLAKDGLGMVVNMQSGLGILWQTLGTAAVGVGAYLIITYYFKCEEIKELKTVIYQRLGLKKE